MRLPTNFKSARFPSDKHTAILRKLEADIEAARFEGIELPVKLKVHESVFVPLAKWAMLMAGNYRCITRQGIRPIKEAVHSDLEASRAVYNWVVKNTRYVALEFGIYGYKPRRCVQTVTRGWGDCKDKATVIVTLLEELGVPSTIVILRTQMRGDFRSTIPSLAAFDHAIVYVPSLDLYLDGTAEYTGSSELPDMDSGALALLVNKGDSKLVRVPERDPKKNVLTRTVSASVGANGDAKLEMDYETRGSESADWRRRAPAHRQAAASRTRPRRRPAPASWAPSATSPGMA